MSPIQAPARPGPATLTDLAWRVVLVAISAAGALAGLPAWSRLPLALAAAVATLTFVLRRMRGTDPLHRLLVAAGGGVVALILLGLLLDVLPSGLSPVAWSTAVAAAELAALLLAGFLRAPRPRPAREPIDRRRLLVASAWGTAVAAVLVGSYGWAVASFDRTHTAPLAVSAERVDGGTVVTVRSGRREGPYELDVVTAAGRTVLAKNLWVGPEEPASATVPTAPDTRALVQLLPAGGTTSVRELVLDDTVPSGSPG